MVTDNHPSYPKTAENSNSTHLQVNHSEAFVNAYGDHTNTIENL